MADSFPSFPLSPESPAVAGTVRLGGPQLQGTFAAGEDDRRSQGNVQSVSEKGSAMRLCDLNHVPEICVAIIDPQRRPFRKFDLPFPFGLRK
jgi:hypothetical protein